MFPAALITAVVTFGVLALQQRGHRPFEVAIIALLAVVFFGVGYDLLMVGVVWPDALAGLRPRWDGRESVLLAAGIVGATVMPHAVYLHSALTKDRIPTRDLEQRRHLLRYMRLDVCLGLGLAGVINLAMVLLAAGLFADGGAPAGDPIIVAHDALGTMIGTCRGPRIRHCAVGVRPVVLQRRHLRGAGGHAGLHRPADPTGGAARRDDAAGVDRARASASRLRRASWCHR